MGAGVRDAFPPPMCCVDCLRVSFGCLMSFGRIVRGCITEIGRGGACVPARVAPQGRIRRSSPRTIRDAQIYFWYGNAAVRTFGRAHRRRPYGFVWADCTWVVLFVGKTVHMNQHHRCCTFDSPGLPTIGDYPG